MHKSVKAEIISNQNNCRQPSVNKPKALKNLLLTCYPPMLFPFSFIQKKEKRLGLVSNAFSGEQKSFNLKLSKDRVVEYTFSRVKKFRVVAEEFRNRLKHCDTMTDISVCHSQLSNSRNNSSLNGDKNPANHQ
jgi:hypothetical protein